MTEYDEIPLIEPAAEYQITYTVEINYRGKGKFVSIDVEADSRKEALGIGKWAAKELRGEVAPGDEMEPTLSIGNVTAEIDQ